MKAGSASAPFQYIVAWCVSLALSGCGVGTSHEAGVSSEISNAIVNQLLDRGRLCSGPLALPDHTTRGSWREPFENYLTHSGVFRRLSSDDRATVFDVAASHGGDLMVLRNRDASKPGVARICFGAIQISNALYQSTPDRDGSFGVDFAYHTELVDWAKPLRDRLRLPVDGTAHALIVRTGDEQRPFVAAALRDLDLHRIWWPLDGAKWYPRGYPSVLQTQKNIRI